MRHRFLSVLALWGCVGALLTGCSTFSTRETIPDALSTAPKPVDTSHVQTLSNASAPKWELRIPDDQPEVDTWARRFSTDKRKTFQTHLYRASCYVVPAQEIFKSQGLPEDLIYVAMVESGFTARARSHANAVGMWQFISSTGKRFGLEQTAYVDERCHPMKAAKAAGAYLSFLYDSFGSWPLALAAYNCGEKAVQAAIDRSGSKTFWELSEKGLLPSETREYVPRVLATVKIVRNPSQYGFHFEPEPAPARHETVKIPGGVKLSWVGKKIGVSEASLQDYNPELCKPVTPPRCSDYELCVPAGTGESLLTALASGPPEVERSEPKPAAASHKIKRGDTWASLAAKYKIPAKTLASLNGMSASQRLQVGRTIRVPAGKSSRSIAVVQTRDKKGQVYAAAAGVKGKKAQVTRQKTSKPAKYNVHQGDTLSSIAERHSISVKTLCAFNDLSPRQKLMPGDRLVIPDPGSSGRERH